MLQQSFCLALSPGNKAESLIYGILLTGFLTRYFLSALVFVFLCRIFRSSVFSLDGLSLAFMPNSKAVVFVPLSIQSRYTRGQYFMGEFTAVIFSASGGSRYLAV